MSVSKLSVPDASHQHLAELLTELSVEPILHAGGTKSSMGGTTVSATVAQTMHAALDVFVPMEELLVAVGDGAARLLGVEAAAVVAGAASGCVLAGAAARAAARRRGLPSTSDVLVSQRRHYGRYTYLYEQAGCRVREIGTMNDCLVSDYAHALDEHTVGVAWLEGPGIHSAGAGLDDVCEVARAHSLPVLVDAAAMAFPIDNLHQYLRSGADLVIVSAGKLMHGPQGAGFVLGRRDLVEEIRQLGFPHQGIGRAHKVPKEMALGAYAALREFVAHGDGEVALAEIGERAERAVAELAAAGVTAHVAHDSMHALPAVVIGDVHATTGRACSALSAELLARARVFVPYNESRDELYLEFASLDSDDDSAVVHHVAAAVRGGRSAADTSDGRTILLASSR